MNAHDSKSCYAGMYTRVQIPFSAPIVKALVFDIKTSAFYLFLSLFTYIIATIIEPDKVIKEINNDKSINVLFEKKLNGRNLAITVLSNKKNTLTLKSARIFKNSISPSSDAEAPRSTSKTLGGMNNSSTSIIRENSEKSTENAKKDKKRFSLDIDSFDSLLYNEIQLSTEERNRLQSEVLTWDANKRNVLTTRTLSNEYTYRYMLDNDGEIHVYEKKAINIHERGNQYDKQNRERPDTAFESVRIGQRNDRGNFNSLQNGRNSGTTDSRDDRPLRSERRSERAGYSKNVNDVDGVQERKRIVYFDADERFSIDVDEVSKTKEEVDDAALLRRYLHPLDLSSAYGDGEYIQRLNSKDAQGY